MEQTNPTPNPAATSPQSAIKIKSPPLVWNETQEVLRKIEQKLQGRVVTYFTAAGWSIVGDDVKYFYSHLKNIGFQEKLYFILISSGGDGTSAYRIAALLKEFCKELVIVLPERAASAATMLSLAGDAVLMTPLAYLTAVDTSLMHPLNPKDKTNSPIRVELEEVKRAVKRLSEGENPNTLEVYKTLFNYVHPVALGAMERSTNLSEMVCRDIMELRRNVPYSDDVKNKLIDKLNTWYPMHGYPIPRDKAKELGIPIIASDSELDALLWDLMNNYIYFTEPVRTDLSDSFLHTETMTKIIESTGTRLFMRNTLERKLDPIIKGWSVFKDEFKWMWAYEKEENGQKQVKVSYLYI